MIDIEGPLTVEIQAYAERCAGGPWGRERSERLYDMAGREGANLAWMLLGGFSDRRLTDVAWHVVALEREARGVSQRDRYTGP